MLDTTDGLNAEPDAAEQGVNLLDIVLLFTGRWKLIVGLTVAFALAGAILSSFRAKLYTARASFTTQSEAPAGALFIGRQADPTLALLKSNAVADFVVRDINLPALQASLHIPVPEKLKDPKLFYRGMVKGETKVEDGGDGVYTIAVKDPYPQRAVAIANGFLTALQDMSFRMNAESAAISRQFFERQLAESRRSLQAAEQELRDAQARTGVLQPSSQTGQELGEISQLRSQLTGLQVQRATLAQSSTAENPAMVRLGAQISETQAKINDLLKKTHSKEAEGLPYQNLEMARLERAVAEQQSIVTALSSQYEHAQMQERFTAPRVRTVDRAELPLPPASRQRGIITAIGAAVGLVLSLSIVMLSAVRKRLMGQPGSAARIRLIQQSLGIQKT